MAALKTRVATTDEADRQRKIEEENAMDTSETLPGKRGRAFMNDA